MIFVFTRKYNSNFEIVSQMEIFFFLFRSLYEEHRREVHTEVVGLSQNNVGSASGGMLAIFLVIMVIESIPLLL